MTTQRPLDQLKSVLGDLAIAMSDYLNTVDELKVVRGPFSAIVDLEKRQLTLIVEDCYAQRERYYPQSPSPFPTPSPFPHTIR